MGPLHSITPPNGSGSSRHQKKRQDKRRHGRTIICFGGVLTAFGSVSLCLSIASTERGVHQHSHNNVLENRLTEWEQHRRNAENDDGRDKESDTKRGPDSNDASRRTHPLAGLSCVDHGGPADGKLTQEMVYWQDIPSDNQHVSPFYAPNRYLVFEPDHAGWNNVRMGLETIIALAFAMGRTLVLPPAHSMPKVPEFSYDNFFDMPSIHAEHNGFDIISTEEFIKRQLDHPETATLRDLPSGRTNWDNQSDAWFEYLQPKVKNLVWDPHHCIAYFPAEANHDVQSVQERFKAMVRQPEDLVPSWEDYVGKPTPLNATEWERLSEMVAERDQLCLYGPDLQHEPILHVPHEAPGATDDDGSWDSRLLVHFYAMLFFANEHQDLWMKRFVRDHIRYSDEIQCAAARVVASMRDRARTVHHKADGLFHSMHVRRGDFEFLKTRVSAKELLRMTSRQFQDGDVVFVATDQHDKSFFDPLKKHYFLYFLDDFVEDGTIGSKVNTHFYGLIDQLVASRGKLFFGCWFSTFTGYINRLRGYHSQLQQEPGYEDGLIHTSFYYAPPDRYDHMSVYYPVKKSFFAREFPTAWRLLNRDLTTAHAPMPKLSTTKR